MKKKSGDDYEQIFDMETRENSHDVSLDSGSYRFKVEFKNVFGQVAFVTEYKYFEILEVYQPKLFLISDSAINKERCLSESLISMQKT